MTKKLGRPSPATVIACLALFFAVAGGSAIALQGRNSVDSGDIKPKAVKTSDIANNAVTTKKIKKNGVRAADIQNDAVGTGEIRNGQVRAADIAPAENVRLVGTPGNPTFANGGEGDCIWGATPAFPFPFGFSPPGFYKDSLGYVHLTGIAWPTDGPGGDAQCGGPGAGEASEDGLAFILPEGYRPTEDVLGGVGAGDAVVIGTTPVSSPPDSYPAGGVIGLSPGSGVLLDGVVLEPPGVAGGVPRRGNTTNNSGGELPESAADLLTGP